MNETAFRDWFSQYTTWMTTHKYGIDERDARNNHGTCWVMQVAEFARYVGRDDLLAFCRDRYRTVLVPNQIAAGRQLSRRRCGAPSRMAITCSIWTAWPWCARSSRRRRENLWTFTTPDGRGIRKAFEFMVPFIADKKKWTRKPDVMYFDEWPVRHPALLFGGLALKEPSYIELWKKLEPDPTVEEVVRNFFIRQPVLWR